MAEEKVTRKLTTILAADVEGYTRLMRVDEEATLKTLGEYREICDGLIARHDGRVFSTGGDSVLAEFGSAVEAVRCAISCQEEISSRNAELGEDRRLMFRIGINVGDVMVRDGDLFGDGVNVAARLEGLAEPGGVCISGSVFEQIKHKLSLGFEDMGAQEVKNIAEPVSAYRLVPGQVSVSAGATATAKPSGARRWRMPAIAVAVAVIIAVGGLAVWRPWEPEIEPASVDRMAFALPDKPSIAVLPFANLSDEPEQEHFADGMTDDLITDLSKISGLFVIARNSSFAYKGQQVKVRQVAEDLGVRYVVEGSVRRASNTVRITAQLIDATTGFHVWAERYDGELTDIFSLQDEITGKIVAALAVELTPVERETLGRKPTENLEAYDYFLRGLEHYRRSTQEANAEARYMFEKTIDLDPKFVAAYTMLGWTNFSKWAMMWSQDPIVLERAFDLAQNALSMDQSQASAHTLLSHVYLWKRRHAEAIAEAEKAIALDPNDADGYADMAEVLTWAGRPGEAVVLVERAMRLDPQYPVYYLWSLGHAYWLAEEPEKAAAALERAVIRNPDWMPAHAYLCVVYSEMGRTEEAEAELAEIRRLSPGATLEAVRQRLPYKDPAIIQRFLDGLRKVELPE